MSLLSGRRGLIVGIANTRSLAFGIAQTARERGAELAITYQNQRLRQRVESVAHDLGANVVLPCDVTDDQQIGAVADRIRSEWGRLDFLVHAVAHADADDLAGRFLDTRREGWAHAMDVSVYSLLALVRALEPSLRAGRTPSVLTLTYLGSQRVVPGYKVMGVAKAALEAAVRYLAVELGPAGIRVNALSVGPVKTLSAAGVRGLRKLLARVPQEAPLRRNVSLEEVGRAALIALSDLGAAVTGEITYVDSGYHALAMSDRSGTESDEVET